MEKLKNASTIIDLDFSLFNLCTLKNNIETNQRETRDVYVMSDSLITQLLFSGQKKNLTTALCFTKHILALGPGNV